MMEDRVIINPHIQRNIFRQICEEYSLTHRELSRRLDIPTTTLRHWAKGNRSLRYSTFITLGRLFPQYFQNMRFEVARSNWGQVVGGKERARQMIVPIRKAGTKTMARLIAFLLSDGGLSRRTHTSVIHFSSRSPVLMKAFRETVGRIAKCLHINRQKHDCFIISKNLGELLLDLSPSYRKSPCNSHPVCPILKGRAVGPCKKCKPSQYAGRLFPPVKIPSFVMKDRRLWPEFLQIISSAEGYVKIWERDGDLKAGVGIACAHPMLARSYCYMLKQLGIMCAFDGRAVMIRQKKSIKSFSDKINFLSGVTVSEHSPKWKGYEKKELLEKLLCKLYWRVPGSVS